MNGIVKEICISSVAGQPMQKMHEVEAIKGLGIEGDRYAKGEGSFNKKKAWWEKIPLIKFIIPIKLKRQVTLMNGCFFKESAFEFLESRRNVLVEGVELMWLNGREFQIGQATFRGVKYCDPCNRPSKLAHKAISFKEAFEDRGGLIADVIVSGRIKAGDPIIPPPKGY